MRKPDTGRGPERKVEQPAAKPPQAEIPGKQKRGPSKSRAQAWAKIDAGKGVWKPR